MVRVITHNALLYATPSSTRFLVINRKIVFKYEMFGIVITVDYLTL